MQKVKLKLRHVAHLFTGTLCAMIVFVCGTSQITTIHLNYMNIISHVSPHTFDGHVSDLYVWGDSTPILFIM